MLKEFITLVFSEIIDSMINVAWEYVIIIFLAFFVLIVILLYVSKKEKYRGEMQRQKEEFKHNLSAQKQYYDNELSDYKTQVKENLHKSIHLGESFLIEIFKQAFKNPLFSECTIYYHLRFRNGDEYKEADFFIVSPKGLFVVESKAWNGVTFIYKDNSDIDIFSKTSFKKLKSFGAATLKSHDFGTEREIEVKVFNATYRTTKKSTDNKDITEQIVFSNYGNPFAQARKYSLALTKQLEVPLIRNLITFNQQKCREVIYNNEHLAKVEKIDNMTFLLMDNYLVDFLLSLPDTLHNTKNVTESLETKLNYRFKMDITNYNQAPFSFY